PYSCAAHDRSFMREQVLDARYQRRIRAVAGGDQHVAHEARMTGAPDRCTGKALSESRVVESQQISEAGALRLRPDGYLLVVCGLGKLVPWAGRETVVAAKNAVADG